MNATTELPIAETIPTETTAEAITAPTVVDLARFLRVDHKPLADAVAAVGVEVMSEAWGTGIIELGQRAYCVTGNVDIRRELADANIEDADCWEWSGPKNGRSHGHFSDLWARDQRGLSVGRYRQRRQTVDPISGDLGVEFDVISEEEGRRLTSLSVRLTDAGMKLLSAAK